MWTGENNSKTIRVDWTPFKKKNGKTKFRFQWIHVNGALVEQNSIHI